MEILIRVADRYESETGRLAFERGDVIAGKPDGWNWSPRELTNPNWRIFQLQQFTLAEVESLLAPELDPEGLKPYVWRRAKKLDMDNVSIPPAIAAFIADDSRAEPIYNVVGSANNIIRALEIIKDPAAG